MNRLPSRLASVAEIIVDCRFWRIVHAKLPYKYNGTKYITTCTCTAPDTKPCNYKNGDPRVGGCAISGNVAKVPRELRP